MKPDYGYRARQELAGYEKAAKYLPEWMSCSERQCTAERGCCFPASCHSQKRTASTRDASR